MALKEESIHQNRHQHTLNYAYNEKSAITKENTRTKYTLFTYNDVTLNEKLSIMMQNLHIFFLF